MTRNAKIRHIERMLQGHYSMDDIPLKRCTGPCGQELPATTEFFARAKASKDRLAHECKACKSARKKAYRKRPEVIEHERIYMRIYMQSYTKRPEARNLARERERIYCQKTEDKVRRRANKRNRLARKKAIAGQHTEQQIQSQLKNQRYKCYYCSAKLEKISGKYKYDVDHTFPLSRVVDTDIPANDISYLVLACPTCNQKKGNKFPWEFYQGGKLL